MGSESQTETLDEFMKDIDLSDISENDASTLRPKVQAGIGGLLDGLEKLIPAMDSYAEAGLEKEENKHAYIKQIDDFENKFSRNLGTNISEKLRLQCELSLLKELSRFAVKTCQMLTTVHQRKTICAPN